MGQRELQRSPPFLVVARERSFTRAAAQLDVSPSAAVAHVHYTKRLRDRGRGAPAEFDWIAMARMSPEAKRLRIVMVMDGWQRLAKDAVFSRMSLAEFAAEVRPSLEVRAEIADLQRRVRIALARRESADARSFELITRIGFAVKGDPNHGRDSDLCEALGYTRERARRQNIRRGMRRKRPRKGTAAW